MEETDDPYSILGVSEDASAQQIKSAYRKLALKHHPDKQKTDVDRKVSTVTFAKISNAYELLSDETQRREYDQRGQAPPQQKYSKMPRRRTDHEFFHQAHFHDPFSVFEQVFRQEFGDFHRQHHQHHHQHHQQQARSPFDDPFFNGGGLFGGGDPFGSMFGGGDPFGSMFGGDPFAAHRSMFGGGRNPDPFNDASVARRNTDPFAGGIYGQMNDMMNMHERMMRGNGMHDLFRDAADSQVSYSSSTANGNGARSVSTSTTTRIVNGKRQTVTERVVTNPDGSVERNVTTTGDEDFASLPASNNYQGYLGYDDALEPHAQRKIKKRRSSGNRKTQG